jgi:tRNA/tmRNA/rRNA uracil-C5-methylase (TrmA/RlmC/RlmD family)
VSDTLRPSETKPSQKGVVSFLPIIGSPLSQGYRNKIEFSFGVYKQQREEYREWEKQQRATTGLPRSTLTDSAHNDEIPEQFLINNER